MKRWTAVIVVVAAAAVLVWIAVMQMPDGRLHVYFLDVAGGQGLTVQTPTGRYILVDGGTEASTLLSALGRRQPFWQHKLEYVVATGHNSGALGALYDVCARYEIGAAIAPPPDGRPSPLYEAWRTRLALRDIPFLEARDGIALQTPDGVQVQVVAAATGTLALRITYGAVDVLLPGPAPPPDLPIQAAIVAYVTSAASPRQLGLGTAVHAVVLWSGAYAGGGLTPPHWPGVQVYSTATHGTLHVISDGQEIMLASEH